MTITPVLKKKFSDKKNGIINLRITENRRSTYISLGISLAERFWNKNGKSIEAKLRDHRDFDKDLRKAIIDKLTSKYNEQNEIHRNAELQNIPIQNQNQSFIFHLNKNILFLEERKKIGTSKRYRTTLYHIEKFLKPFNKPDLLFSEITSDFVERFETHLIGTGLLPNTTKNYINCIKRLYTKAVKTGLYSSLIDPFVYFENRRTVVKKGFLEKKHVDLIRELKLEEGTPLYHTRNYFLFQIFGQGLRISDLLTLRFSNIVEGEVVFFQYKTKKEHIIYLTEMVMFLLKNYVNDKSFEKILAQKWKYKFKGEELNGTYHEIQSKYTELTNLKVATAIEKTEERKHIQADIEYFKLKIVDIVREKMYAQMLTALHIYAKNHTHDFIFPIINPQLFANVVFDGNTTLSKPQYNHLQSKTTIYNKMLKKLADEVVKQFGVKLNIPLTSHVARHTYTNLMISIGGDVYEISKSLGHQGINTTDKYMKILKTRVENKNKDLGVEFSYSME
jgi:site-specific recombinase XerD